MKARINTAICELGPIRPPSEAAALLIRVTRNCPWNKCLFCPVYKNVRFEKRTENEVIQEIDVLADSAQKINDLIGADEWASGLSDDSFLKFSRQQDLTYEERRINLWIHRGDRNVFFQDADSLIRPTHRLLKILEHLYFRFPMTKSVCTYARSRTLAAKSLDDLKKLREAGLTRIHIGLESGSNEVLELVKKGCRAEHHIEGINKAIEAGFEVCCYVMPGLGGRALSEIHAHETARVLQAINPHHIRLRTMFLTDEIPMYQKVISGEMELLEEDEVVAEIRTLIMGLRGLSGYVVSDHDHNLLMDIKGNLTDDIDELDRKLLEFLNLPKAMRDGFIIAKRTGRLRSLSHFLGDKKEQEAVLPLADAFRKAGEGSLMKGLLKQFRPKLF